MRGEDADCASGVCTAGKCAPPACSHVRRRQRCGSNMDCGSGQCTNGRCQAPGCAPTCIDGSPCGSNDDCGSNVCVMGKCHPPACSPNCGTGSDCGANGDCASGQCNNGKCQPTVAGCSPNCSVGQACTVNGDCASDLCIAGKCVAAPCAPDCADGADCGSNADCGSTHCNNGRCQPPGCAPSCNDVVSRAAATTTAGLPSARRGRARHPRARRHATTARIAATTRTAAPDIATTVAASPPDVHRTATTIGRAARTPIAGRACARQDSAQARVLAHLHHEPDAGATRTASRTSATTGDARPWAEAAVPTATRARCARPTRTAGLTCATSPASPLPAPRRAPIGPNCKGKARSCASNQRNGNGRQPAPGTAPRELQRWSPCGSSADCGSSGCTGREVHGTRLPLKRCSNGSDCGSNSRLRVSCCNDGRCQGPGCAPTCNDGTPVRLRCGLRIPRFARQG